jgi:hypothetical protein
VEDCFKQRNKIDIDMANLMRMYIETFGHFQLKCNSICMYGVAHEPSDL